MPIKGGLENGSFEANKNIKDFDKTLKDTKNDLGAKYEFKDKNGSNISIITLEKALIIKKEGLGKFNIKLTKQQNGNYILKNIDEKTQIEISSDKEIKDIFGKFESFIDLAKQDKQNKKNKEVKKISSMMDDSLPQDIDRISHQLDNAYSGVDEGSNQDSGSSNDGVDEGSSNNLSGIVEPGFDDGNFTEETESVRKLQEGIEEGRIIMDRLSNLNLPNGWKWGNNEKKVGIDFKTSGFSIEILSNESTPEKYKLEFDKNGDFIDNTTGIYNGKAFKFDVENGKVSLKNTIDNEIFKDITNKINKFPEQVRGEVINSLEKIQERGYSITIGEEPTITQSSNGNITEYGINGSFSLSNNNKGFIYKPGTVDIITSIFKFDSISNVKVEGNKIKSFDFYIAKII